MSEVWAVAANGVTAIAVAAHSIQIQRRSFL